MPELVNVETILEKHGITDYKFIHPEEIVVSEWVRMKCEFGCPDYGQCAACPPNTPPVEACKRFFREYSRAILMHFQKVAPDKAERKTWSARTNLKLIKLEQEIFLAGYHKVFLLFMDSCEICADCAPFRADCKEPELARPSPESMAVDVFSTVRKYRFPIEVLNNPNQTMNRYAFLMLD